MIIIYDKGVYNILELFMKTRKNWVRFKDLDKKNKIFRIVNLILMIGLFIASLTISITGKVVKDDSRLFMSGLTMAALFILPPIIELIIGRRISNILVLAYTVYVALSGFVGSLLSIYYIVPGFDKMVHALCGYIMAAVGILVISLCQDYKSLKISTVVVFCVIFSLSIEYVWELFEFIIDRLLNQTMQGAPIEEYGYPLIIDTITDMFCNLGGALIFAAHFLIGKLTKCSLGINYIEKELVIKKQQKKEDNALEEKSAQSEENQYNNDKEGK